MDLISFFKNIKFIDLYKFFTNRNWVKLSFVFCIHASFSRWISLFVWLVQILYLNKVTHFWRQNSTQCVFFIRCQMSHNHNIKKLTFVNLKNFCHFKKMFTFFKKRFCTLSCFFCPTACWGSTTHWTGAVCFVKGFPKGDSQGFSSSLLIPPSWEMWFLLDKNQPVECTCKIWKSSFAFFACEMASCVAQ